MAEENLGNYLKTIADTLRTKKGTTDKINAQDYASEISKLYGADNGVSGSVETEYDSIFVNSNATTTNGKDRSIYLLGDKLKGLTTEDRGSHIVIMYNHDMNLLNFSGTISINSKSTATIKAGKDGDNVAKITAENLSPENIKKDVEILGVMGTLAGSGGTVEDVDVLPEATAENVGKMYYLTTDQNVYECVEERNYTFNVGDTITQQLYLDTTITPEDVITANTPVVIMNASSEDGTDVIAIKYSNDGLNDGGSTQILYDDVDPIDIYYINSTKSLDELNQIYGEAGLLINHYGWQIDMVRMPVNPSFVVNQADNSSQIVFTKSYQNVQLSTGCTGAIDKSNIPTYSEIPTNPTTSSDSIINVNGVIYVLTNN